MKMHKYLFLRHTQSAAPHTIQNQTLSLNLFRIQNIAENKSYFFYLQNSISNVFIWATKLF